MSHTPARRIASALAAGAFLALVLAAPAAARPDPGTGGRDFAPAGTTSTSTSLPPVTVVVDDDAVELMQVGAGLLAGLALAGAGTAMVSRRHHRDPSVA